MGYVAAADPNSKQARAFTNIGDLTQAMEKANYIPLRPDGTPFIVNFLTDEGGYLFDGAPLNVWFDGVWYEGQQEVASRYWGQGGVPTPNESILALPIIPMPGQVAETYQAFKQAQSSSNTMLYVAAGVGLFLLYSLAGKSRS